MSALVRMRDTSKFTSAHFVVDEHDHKYVNGGQHNAAPVTPSPSPHLPISPSPHLPISPPPISSSVSIYLRVAGSIPGVAIFFFQPFFLLLSTFPLLSLLLSLFLSYAMLTIVLQHQRLFSAVHGTHVFFMQNDQGRAKWDPNIAGRIQKLAQAMKG